MWQEIIAVIIVVICGCASFRMIYKSITGTSSKCGCEKSCSSNPVQIEKK